MRETRNEQEMYQAWMDAVNQVWKHGWKHHKGWVFASPSGTLHDLSAADLSQLSRIESERMFITEVDQCVTL